MSKYIGQIYKYSQSQLSTLSLKAPVSSSSDPQISSAIELTIKSIPSVRDKIKTTMFCIPKIPSRMIQASQIMTTYSLVRQGDSYLEKLKDLSQNSQNRRFGGKANSHI